MNEDPEIYTFEKRLRFGCGFIFGAGIGLFYIARYVYDFNGLVRLGVFGIALVCGFLALRFGDAFWRFISDYFRGWH